MEKENQIDSMAQWILDTTTEAVMQKIEREIKKDM